MKYPPSIQTVRGHITSFSRRYARVLYGIAILAIVISSWQWSLIGIGMVTIFGLFGPLFGVKASTIVKSAIGLFGLIIVFTFFSEAEVVEYLSICAFVLLVFAIGNIAITQLYNKNRTIKA